MSSASVRKPRAARKTAAAKGGEGALFSRPAERPLVPPPGAYGPGDFGPDSFGGQDYDGPRDPAAAAGGALPTQVSGPPPATCILSLGPGGMALEPLPPARPVLVLGEAHDAAGKLWSLYHADAVDLARQLPDNSVDLNAHSPPFSNLYAYSKSRNDMGNCVDDDQFFQQYLFLIHEMLRVMRPGRLVAVHCKDLVDYRGRDGRAGLRDFPAAIVRAYEACNSRCQRCADEGRCPWGQEGPFCRLCGGPVTVAPGFKLHSNIIIWKCPVLERARTNAHGLLYKSLRADSSFSRQGLMEYVKVFRKWPATEAEAANVVPVRHTKTDFTLPEWQQIASPVWVQVDPGPAADEVEFEALTAALAPWGEGAVAAGRAALRARVAIPRADIDVTNVLNVQMAEANRRDEGHMCPLQLDVIDRLIRLYSNPGETVWSPFAGIGSEGVGALRAMRRELVTPVANEDDIDDAKREKMATRLVEAPRRFIGTELKKEYFDLATANLRGAEPGARGSQTRLFDV